MPVIKERPWELCVLQAMIGELLNSTLNRGAGGNRRRYRIISRRGEHLPPSSAQMPAIALPPHQHQYVPVLLLGCPDVALAVLQHRRPLYQSLMRVAWMRFAHLIVC